MSWLSRVACLSLHLLGCWIFFIYFFPPEHNNLSLLPASAQLLSASLLLERFTTTHIINHSVKRRFTHVSVLVQKGLLLGRAAGVKLTMNRFESHPPIVLYQLKYARPAVLLFQLCVIFL